MFEEVIAEVFLTPQKLPGKAVCDAMEDRIRRINEGLESESKISSPARATVYRWLKDLYHAVALRARDGKETSERQMRGTMQGLRVNRILERYEIDHTPVDARLLLDFEESTVKADGRLYDRNGLAAVLFPLQTLPSYFPESSKIPSGLLTIPEVAQRLQVKQEVAYAIVRRGVLPTISHRVGRRTCQLVEERRIGEFAQSYVLARDLAQQFGISPKSVSARLRSIGVVPALGPSIDGCRQTIYHREDVDDSLRLSGDACSVPMK